MAAEPRKTLLMLCCRYPPGISGGDDECGDEVVRVGAAALSGSFEGVKEDVRGYGMLYRALPRIARGISVYDERS